LAIRAVSPSAPFTTQVATLQLIYNILHVAINKLFQLDENNSLSLILHLARYLRQMYEDTTAKAETKRTIICFIAGCIMVGKKDKVLPTEFQVGKIGGWMLVTEVGDDASRGLLALRD
jgi:hypothetical protein